MRKLLEEVVVKLMKQSFLGVMFFLLLLSHPVAHGFIFPGFPGFWNFGDSTTMIDGKYQNSFGSRGYKLFVPSQLSKNPGLLVVLHGCFLTGDQMASGTGLNLLGEANNFLVLYPEQTYGDNPWKCWNWFKPENHQRSGELSIIAEMTREIVKVRGVDSGKVFVTGISSGAATASNILACYSDVFAGGLLHSGLEYRAAQTEEEGHTAMKNGSTQDLDESAERAVQCSPPTSKLLRVIVIQGTKDPYVGTINADRTNEQMIKINGILWIKSGGLPTQVTTRSSRIEQNDRKFNAAVTETLFGKSVIVKKIMVEGMGHGWSGGNSTAPYMEPRGVNASQLLVDFLLL
ncbi:MAG: PHB depolymerase family esterase [Bdellovibrionales bacterium]|jgi:poly(hydroxyalkanoate) depolymerase family esterase|nr:PHB depolymerase family esterase [Bdellovibrionales bacterium]